MMELNTTTVNLKEFGLDIRGGKEMIFRIIDNQISNYKIQFLMDWEGNHKISSQEKDRKIQKLKSTKEELNRFFNQCNSGNTEIDFTFNLEVKNRMSQSNGIKENERVTI